MRYFLRITKSKKIPCVVSCVDGVGEDPSPGGGGDPKPSSADLHTRKFSKKGKTMEQKDQNGTSHETKEQQVPPTCHTITDLFHPEEKKDSETPLSFGSWQVVGKF